MKKLFKKIILLLIIGIMVIIPCKIVIADSGFDSSYDSGGSDWSSSDSYSSSDSWSDSDSSGSSNHVVTKEEVIFCWIVVGLIIAFYIWGFFEMLIKKTSSYAAVATTSNYKKMSDDEIKKIDSMLDNKIIVDKTFNLYKDLQNAWMEFDNDNIRKLVSDEMYNMYKMQLDTLKSRHQKNIMEDITKVSGFVVSIKKQGNVETCDVVLNVRMKDYIVDHSGEIVRGHNNTIGIAYLITIDKVNDEVKRITNCPNCGYEVSDEASQKCKYCGSDLVLESKNFIITKKQNIGQGNDNFSVKPTNDDVSSSEININDYDKSIDNSMFKTKVDNIFVQLYTGLSNGDLKDVDHKISDNVYKIYKDKVDNDKKDNLKHVFGELNVTSTEILSVDDSSDKIIVKVRLVSKYMDYYVNKDTLEFVKGNNKSKDVHYNTLTFMKNKNAKDIKESLYCPGCGKAANVNESGCCKYCGAIFNTEDYDYVLTDIQVL